MVSTGAEVVPDSAIHVATTIILTQYHYVFLRFTIFAGQNFRTTGAARHVAA